MKNNKLQTVTLAVALSVMSMGMTSCYVTRTTVGTGPSGKDANVTQYSSAKQLYLLAGLIALNNADPNKPTDGNYQVITKQSFVDGLVTGITCDIFSMRTIKVVTKKK
jgi:hypothetical protein